MSIEDTSEFEGIEKPELFFGIAAALGAPLHSFQAVIESAVRGRGYDVEVACIHVFHENVPAGSGVRIFLMTEKSPLEPPGFEIAPECADVPERAIAPVMPRE